MSGLVSGLSGLAAPSERVSGLSGLNGSDPTLFEPAHPLNRAGSERDVSGLSDQPAHPLTSANTPGERVERVTSPFIKTSEEINKREKKPAHTRSPAHPLKTWLDSLRQRRITIQIRDSAPELAGERWTATAHDTDQLARHTHALTIAAGHPAWWNHAAGRTATIPDADQLPTIDGDTYPCATCGQPADWLDAQLLAWCDTHVARDLVAAARAWRAA